MPARKSSIKVTSETAPLTCNGAPVYLTPAKKPAKQQSPEDYIINHIKIEPSVTLTWTRKLIKAAVKHKKLSIQIGMDPTPERYYNEEEPSGPAEPITESSHHPLSPRYYYCGADLRKLEPRLLDNLTMLQCTATLSYGEGGMSVDDNDDAESALDIIKENYREPELTLYF